METRYRFVEIATDFYDPVDDPGEEAR